MSSSINDLKQKIRNLKEKKQRIQQSIRHIWDDIGGLQSDTKEQHRLFPTQEDFREAIQVREHHVERLEFTLLQIEMEIRELEERIEMGKEDKNGAGFSRERDTNNGNLRIIGGAGKRKREDDESSSDDESESDDESRNEYPYYYNDMLDVMEQDLEDVGDEDERREIWEQYDMDNMYYDSENYLMNQVQNREIHLNNEQWNWINSVRHMYLHWKRNLYPNQFRPNQPDPPDLPNNIP